MKTIGYAILFLFLTVSLQSAAQLYTFRNFSHKNGLHTVSVRSLAQSNDGYLWIGTEGMPLVRYDGTEFREMRVDGQDSYHHIVQMEYWNDTIFFASQFKGFYAFIPAKNKYLKFPSDTKNKGDALAVINTKKEKYFIAQKYIFRYSKGKSEVIHTCGNPINLYHSQVFNDRVFLFTSAGNYVINGGKLRPLNEVLGISEDAANKFKYGHVQRQKLVLCDEQGEQWMELGLSSNKIVERRSFTGKKTLEEGDFIVSYDSQTDQHSAVALTNNGHAYIVVENKFRAIPNNYSESIESSSSIIADLNGDFWFGSRTQGLYKVSLEPFTRIQLHPNYETPNIGFPYLTRFRDVFISTHDGVTKVGNFNSDTFEEFPFTIRSVSILDNSYYIGTNKGLKKFIRNDDNPAFEEAFLGDQPINLVLCERSYLWVGIEGKGLYRIHERNGEPVKVKGAGDTQIPDYIYTGQIGCNGKQIYFGTNDGIFYTDKSKAELHRLQIPEGFGSYSGTSTKDVHGTIWFTMEKGLIGITEKGDLRVIRGEKYLSTNLFYTLSSDRLGNLILGTNKGIGIFKVNANGLVEGFASYGANSGFDGYETHMRSQFQSDNNIYVGTVEGLFLINTDILDQLRVPIKPVILAQAEAENFNKESHNSFRFTFRVNNPKSGRIFYSYRLIGSDSPEWRTLKKAELNLIDLPPGTYQLEVRASHDGKNFSPIATHPIYVPIRLQESYWVILLIIFGMIALNLFIVRYSKRTDRGTLIRRQDMAVHSKMVPVIILIGVFAGGGSLFLGPLLSEELTVDLASVITITMALTALYFLARSIQNTEKSYQLNNILIVGVVILMGVLYYESFRSNLHPFHLLGIVLTCMIVPYFLHGIRSMVFFTSTILVFTVLLILFVQEPVYPKPLFAIANAILITLLIFSSFIRSSSLERLIFISGIINRGTTPTLAFNSEGKIVFASENISNYIDVSHDDLINMDISILNSYVPFEGKHKNVDVVREFNDGSSYIVPLINSKGDVHWIEWQYRQFSDDVKVMLGQEISEKMELENTYELLVQNAEDFIYRLDIHGNFIFLNDICFERLGYEKEDLLHKNATVIVPDDFQKEVAEFYTDHFRERKVSSYKEFPILAKDGNIVWIGQHVTTIFAPGSTTFISGFIALARDITSFRRQQQLIKDQRDDITSSINYAQRIQFNLLPHQRYFTSAFREHFIVYKPKDIVSGDFYWMEQVGDTTVLALGDCTGHGVPGAFMTLVGVNLLNTIVKENRVLNPGKILDELDKKLVDVLPRNPNKNSLNDGMEITICTLEDASNQLAFACAGSRFLVHTNDSFTMFKGDNKHIGDQPIKGFSNYTTQYTPFTLNDTLYLFTDGMQDQFGGEEDKKFSFRRVLSMFEKNATLPLPDQRKNVENQLDEWIGTGEQTDDISIVSIKKKLPDNEE